MNALIIDDDYGRLATNYYAKIPNEPTSAKNSLNIAKTHTIPQTSIVTMLETILKTTKAGSDLILVSHGNENGLTMPLIPRYGRDGRTNHLQTLMSGDPTEKIAEHFSLKPNIVVDLLAKADLVRKLKLGHIAFRGCSIGGEMRNLSTLKDFIGAAEVSGTSLLSTFGHVSPRVFDAKRFAAAWKSGENKAHLSGAPGKRVIFHRSPGKKPYTENISLILESEEALLPWLQGNFLASTTKNVAISMKNDTRVHYLLYTPPILPLDKGSLGYADFIFTAS